MEFMIETVYVNAYKLNIYLHIGVGTLAMLLGLTQLVNQKGSDLHRRIGRLFFMSFSVVIATATLGLFLFEFRAFLTVLTLTAGYSCLSGYRVLILKGARPKVFDNTVATLSFIACVSFVFAVEYFQLNFSKPTIYATLSGLALTCLYDAARNVIPLRFLKRTWLNEHIVKMIGSLSALLSAASGNLLPSFGAVSQLAPTLICSILIIVFLFFTNPRSKII